MEMYHGKVANMEKYRDQWEKLEGREKRQEQNRQQILERPSRSMGMGR
jgi:hypothetical protein